MKWNILSQKDSISMPDIKIREAHPDDLEILQSFEQGIIQFERPFAPNLKDDPITYYDLLQLIEREDAKVIVATVDNNIVGSGYALIKTSPPYKNPEKFVYLGFMFVLPEYRGKGINGMIIDDLVAWSQERKMTDFQLDVYAENEIALNAYLKRKFKPYLLKMRLDLEND